MKCPHGVTREHCADCWEVQRNIDNLAVTFPNGAPPNRAQIGGQHYAKMKIQVWDFVIANEIPYMEASCIKYLCRWRDKGGIEDLKKARHFLDKLIEVSE